MSMMLGSMMKGMGLNPDEIIKSITDIATLVRGIHEGIARVEKQNAEILEHLKNEQAHLGNVGGGIDAAGSSSGRNLAIANGHAPGDGNAPG